MTNPESLQRSLDVGKQIYECAIEKGLGRIYCKNEKMSSPIPPLDKDPIKKLSTY